jgi:hypothetical protein
MKRKMAVLLAAASLTGALALPRPALADDQTVATAGAGGLYPAGTSFTGIHVSGLQLAFGAELNADQTGLGNFTAVLLGVSALGVDQYIVVEGEVTGGTSPGANVTVLSGTTSLDLGDGTGPIPALPFTATLTRNPANNLGTVGLVVGNTTMPNATLNAGSMSIVTLPGQ